MDQFAVLTPHEFRDKSRHDRGADVGGAYREFLCNCNALCLRANTAIARQTEAIIHGSVVDLGRNYIGAAGFQAMITLLSRNENLRELRLPANGLNNDAVVFFARSMRQHPSLQLIDFSDNAISLTGGLALLSLVQVNRALTQIIIENTQVPKAVLDKIDRCTRSNKALCNGASTTHVPVVVSQTMGAAPPIVDPLLNEDRCKNSNADRSGRPDTVSSKETAGHECVAPVACTARDIARRARWEHRETQFLEALQKRLLYDAATRYIPPADIHTGWRVLEVAILAPPCIFECELEALANEVFPRINEELRDRRILLIPKVNREEHPAGTNLRHLRFGVLADTLREVKQSRFLTIELIGDRAGDYELLPANEITKHLLQTNMVECEGPSHARRPSDGSIAISAILDGAPSYANGSALPLRPLLYAAHEASLKHSSWIIVATRKDTKRMGLPSSLAPLLTEEPFVEHPDRHRVLVKTTLTPNPSIQTSATELRTLTTTTKPDHVAMTTTKFSLKGEPSRRIACDYNVQERRWREHQFFKAYALDSVAAPELVIADYHARYAGTNERGQICLTELDEFNEAVYQRIMALAYAAFPVLPPCVPDHFSGPAAEHTLLHRRADQRVTVASHSSAVAACAYARKHLISRIDLFVMTPPRRNALVVHSRELSSLTSLLAVCTNQLLSKPYAFTVAFHSTRLALLRDEPTDLRDVIIDLISQLSTSSEVLHYLQTEVDVARLQHFFLRCLTDGKPAPLAGSAKDYPQDAGGVQGGEHGHHPHTALPDVTATKLLSCEGDSQDNSVLVVILDGVDAVCAPTEPCKALRFNPETGVDEWGAPVSQNRPDDVGFIPMCLSRSVRFIGSCLSSSPYLPLLDRRGKDSVELLPTGTPSSNMVEQMLSPMALQPFGVVLSDDDFIVARDKRDAQKPEYINYLIHALMQLKDVPGCVSQAHTLREFPETLEGAARSVYAQLCQHFGNPLVKKLLGLLTVARWGILEPELVTMLKLSPRRFSEMMRILLPVIEQPTAPTLGAATGNAALGRVRIAAPSFLALIHEEELHNEGSDTDRAVWHDTLAMHYFSTVKRSIALEKTAVFGLAPTSPYERHAVKELPYHLAECRSWSIFDSVVLSPAYMMLVYRNSLGYQYLRDLTAAFNTRNDQYILGESIGDLPQTLSLNPDSTSRRSLPDVLCRFRDYIFFARRHGGVLFSCPHLVLQTATQTHTGNGLVRRDAETYIRKAFLYPTDADRHTTFFIVRSAKKSKAFLGSIPSVRFSHNGKHLIAGSTDRSVAWVDPANGSAMFHARAASSRVARVSFCRTNAYVAVLAEDRSVYLYDTAVGKMVSKNDGSLFTAPITDFGMSARGRWYCVATEDVVVRVYDTEKSILLFSLTMEELVPHTLTNVSAKAAQHQQRNYLTVLADPTMDEVLTTVVNDYMTTWRVLQTRDGATVQRVHKLPAVVSRCQWCCNPNAQEIETDLQAADRNASFVLMQVVSGEYLSLYSMHKGCETARLAPHALHKFSGRRPSSDGDEGFATRVVIENFAISPHCRWIAAACNDARIDLYLCNWEAWLSASVDIAGVFLQVPVCEFTAFAYSTVARIIGIAFRHDDGALLAVGNQRQLKYWACPEQQSVDVIECSSSDGEFLLDHDVSSWDVAQGFFSQDTAEVAVGDVTGQLTLLGLWRPSE